jgi:hypothetical protein
VDGGNGSGWLSGVYAVNGRGWLWLLIASLACLMLALSIHFARAADNGHTHEGAVGEFYQTWKMPDRPTVSCCNDKDCGPAASRFIKGHWQAQEPEGEWVDIPDEKVEQNRDSPDGRSHLCGRRLYQGFTVFCFARGGGT